MTYQEALDAGKKIGASRASDESVMAMFCESSLQIIVGAVSPRLVWEGAQKAGMTGLDLARLASTDPDAVHELMWS